MFSKNVQTYTLVALLAGTGVLAFLIIRPFVIPLALGVIFAVVLQPVYNGILRGVPGWRGLAAFLTIVLMVLVLMIPLSFIATRGVAELHNAYVSLTEGNSLGSARGAILYTGAVLNRHIPGSEAVAFNLADNLSTYAQGNISRILQHTGAIFSSLIALIVELFVFFITLFACLKHGPAIYDELIKLSPFEDKDDRRIFQRLALTINSVVRGSLAVALIQGVTAAIGYTIFGVPNPFLWGVATSIASFVPGVGTSLIWIPAVIYLFITGHTIGAVGLLIWAMTAVGLIDNIVGPFLMGRGIHLPSLVILISVLGGIAFFGPAGIFLGPLTVSLLLALFSLYSGEKL